MITACFVKVSARLLQSEPGFEVVAHCGSRAEAIRILKSREVDIVLLDLDFGPERGTDLLDDLRTIRFGGKVLLVTAGVNERDVVSLIQKGISGILMKHNSPTLLIQGIRDAMNGKVSFEQDLLKRATSRSEAPVPTPAPGLTVRERNVLSFIFEGLSNKEIAGKLQISESSVKSCLQSLFTKTGVRTRSQLCGWPLSNIETNSREVFHSVELSACEVGQSPQMAIEMKITAVCNRALS